MPLYDFECESCGVPFEALVAAGTTAPCPGCGSERTHRHWGPIAPMTSPLRLSRRRAAAFEADRREREERRTAAIPPDSPEQKPPAAPSPGTTP